jgi:hypothetical protein
MLNNSCILVEAVVEGEEVAAEGKEVAAEVVEVAVEEVMKVVAVEEGHLEDNLPPHLQLHQQKETMITDLLEKNQCCLMACKAKAKSSCKSLSFI